jgi:hypothetical protein
MKTQSRKGCKGLKRILWITGLAWFLSLAHARAGSVKLAWDPNPESTVSGYNVYRGTTSGGPYTQINTSLVLLPYYADYDAEPGKTYFYVVTAVNFTAGRESAYSRELKVVTGRHDPGDPSGISTVRVMADIEVYTGEMVHLSGSGWHSEGDVMTYAWTQVDGPSISLANAGSEDAAFIAPHVKGETSYSFKLTATDSAGKQAFDQVTVKVKPR